MKTMIARRLSTVAAACVALPGFAHSADESGVQRTGDRASNQRKIEEVVVTAQRREQSLQDVPISLTVMTGEELDRSTSGGVLEALNRVPAVTASVLPQTGSAYVVVRGASQGANTGTGASTTGYYLDGAPLMIGPDTNVYDLRQIEVLRGPQGTLYGVNSVNGVVRVFTNDADLDEFEAKARATGSATDDGGDNYRGDATLNVPLVEGKLAARVVGGYEHLSGWVDRPAKEDFNSSDSSNVRLKLTAKPSDNLDVSLSAWRWELEADGTPASTKSRTRNTPFDEPVTVDTELYSLALSYDFSGFSLNSNTSTFDHNIDGLKRSIFSNNWNVTLQERSTFSQEVLLTSTTSSSFKWNLGAIYVEDELSTLAKNTSFANVPTAPFLINGDRTSESFAVFGQGGYNVTDTLEFALGVRYFEDDIENLNNLTGVIGTAEVSATTPHVGLTWRPSENFTTYVSYGQGFRSGEPQNAVAAAQGLADPEPDRLHSYEAGARGHLFGGRLSYDAALFYMKWEDIQQILGVPLGSSFVGATINGESASGPGFEFSTAFEPIDRLEIGLNASWNDLTFDEDIVTRANSGGTVVAVMAFPKGDRLNASAEYTYGASVDYSFPLGGGRWEARLGASANYQSELISRFLSGATLLPIVGDPITLVSARLGVGPENDRWSFVLFGDNLTDEEGASLGSWLTAQPDEGTRFRPRTFGAQLEYNFR